MPPLMMFAPSAQGGVVGNRDNLLTASVVWLGFLLPQKYKKRRHFYLREK